MIKNNKILKNYFLFQLCLLYFFAISCNHDDVPSVSTGLITDITLNSAVSGGSINSDEGSFITAKGLCWATDEIPTIEDTKTDEGSGNGSFTANMTELIPNTTYYVRAYATNGAGTGYGGQVILKTYTDTVSDVDGNVYYTVTINDRIWMAENLKTTRYADGLPIPFIGSQEEWAAITYTSKAYCWLNDDINNKDIYGALYNWNGAMNGAASSTSIPSGVQGACPTGWHLPSDNEWAELETFLGGDSIAGGKLKETGRTHWLGLNAGATNETGFTALPGGARNSGLFHGYSDKGYFWSSTLSADASGMAYQFSIFNRVVYTRRSLIGKDSGKSVRCIKDY